MLVTITYQEPLNWTLSICYLKRPSYEPSKVGIIFPFYRWENQAPETKISFLKSYYKSAAVSETGSQICSNPQSVTFYKQWEGMEGAKKGIWGESRRNWEYNRWYITSIQSIGVKCKRVQEIKYGFCLSIHSQVNSIFFFFWKAQWKVPFAHQGLWDLQTQAELYLLRIPWRSKFCVT